MTHEHEIPGGPTDKPITGTVYFGDISQACGGTGVCHLSAVTQKINGPAIPGIQVLLDTDDPSGEQANLIISIFPPSLQALMETQYEVYLTIMNCLQTGMPFLPTLAAPFYLDPSLSVLWPGMQGSGTPFGFIPALSPNPGWPVTKANGIVIITIPQILFSASVPTGDTISIGAWTIGTDAFGNLVFSNNSNTVVFGANGNVSINCSQVVTDNTPIYLTNNSNAGMPAVLNGGAPLTGFIAEGSNPLAEQDVPGMTSPALFMDLSNIVDGSSDLTIHVGSPFLAVNNPGVNAVNALVEGAGSNSN